ncbi:MAG: hypothetical protein WBE26_19250 [Phycisphaerae bacterium]
MFLTPSGLLVFSPGDQIRAHTMGFDLNLDEQALKAALEGEVELVDISGWLEVVYDGQAGVLHVFADDDKGTHFEHDYQLHAAGKECNADRMASVHSFFEYMRSDEAEEAGEGATGAGTDKASGDVLQCTGPECSCLADQCQCSICCKSGEYAVCRCKNPDKCQCTCTSAVAL